MSETPQEILSAWIGMGDRPTDAEMSLVTLERVREAICHNVRGEDGPCDCAGCRDVGALLAERDALRSKLFEAEVDRSKYQAEAALRELTGWAGDLVQGWEAHRKLASGFGGMGYNILTETAGRYGSMTYWNRLAKAVDQARAALRDTETGEEGKP